MKLNTPLWELGRIYKNYSRRLEKLGIQTVEDLLFHIPFRYDNYLLKSKIAQLQEGEVVTIEGEVVSIKNEFTRRFRKLQKAKVKDETGTIDVIWFNQPFIVNIISIGDKISLSGKVGKYGNKLTLTSPDYEVVKGETLHTGRLVPVYPETKGVSSKWLRTKIREFLKQVELDEFLPAELLRRYSLPQLKGAIESAHFPKNLSEVETAKKRLSFQELFSLQLKSHKRRQEWEEESFEPLVAKNYKKEIEKLETSLPFILTKAQKKAISEIFEDLSKKRMNRLLQGDVGSGKTIVSAFAIYLSYLNGYQSLLMAPTDILAKQHYQTLSKLLNKFGLRIGLRTRTKKENDKEFDVLVGTHALLSEKVKFKKLGLVIIDEQQRFGVSQRAVLRKKGLHPHLLTMTATPIPRTVALTLYGDLDLSVLSEMPKGRRIVKTWLVPKEKRASSYQWMKRQIKEEGGQIFILCPFIEESETLTSVKAATKEYERLKNIFKEFKVGLLHGKMKTKEKEEIMKDFREGKLDVLVTTPVVEVGIDIPNATVMVIEASERFGLSQLHQLRGRVGRGEKQSYCLLFTEAEGEGAIKRLKALERIYNGAELAELDYKLRGPGDIYGTMQHGLPMLKVASFSDFETLQIAKKEAEKIYKNLSKFPKLAEKIEEETPAQVSPD